MATLSNALVTLCQLNYYYFYDFIIIFIIIIKTSSTGQSRKSKIAYATPRTPAPEKNEKTEKQAQGSNQRLTAPLNPSNVPCQTQCREGHSRYESRPAVNTL